ncbi:MAG: hydroxyacid dehydrogenase [Verrucomicrobia bacterium]|nr:hydroxyacid dehydrogenase [Verrucomicrobiota bacterium]
MSMKPKGIYLLNDDLFGRVYDRKVRGEIGELIDIENTVLAPERISENPAALASVEIIMSSWGCPRFDDALLNAASQLKAVFYGAGTIKGVVSEAFWERDIVITSAYAANAVPVAEYTLAMILFSLKLGWRHVFDGRARKAWPQRSQVPGAYGATIGLISLGQVARHVLELLKPFDLNVIVYDPFLSTEEAQAFGVEKVILEELFKRGHVISLHTPWLPETEGLITKAHFLSMQKDATFINTARGAVVDEAGMTTALKARPDLLAVLDVTHPEPPAADSPLYTLPNVVLTPHIAGSMDHECARMGRYMADELRRYCAGEALRWNITRERASMLA